MIDKIYWGRRSNDVEKKTTSGEDAATTELVFARGNCIHFNGPVHNASINRLIDLSRQLMTQSVPGGKPEYYLYINSYGGYVNEMFRFVDFLEAEIIPNTSRQVSIVHGMAASAGSFIAAAFPERWATRRSTVMIHELASWLGGAFSIIAAEMKSLNDSMNYIVEVYTRITKRSDNEVRDMLLRNAYFTSKEALEFGLVQKVI